METSNNLDFLTARLHGRRSRVADAEQLEVLCNSRTLAEFYGAVSPESAFHSVEEFQRHLVQSLIDEVREFSQHLAGTAAHLIEWIMVRFQVENVKLLVRGLITSAPLEQILTHLAILPKALALDPGELLSAASVTEFFFRLPNRRLRTAGNEIANIPDDQLQPFFVEGIVDRAYFRELLRRIELLADDDRPLIRAVAQQEADLFHFALVARGQWLLHLAPELLLRLHVDGTRISRYRFAEMLAAPDSAAVSRLVVGRALDHLPTDGESNVAAPADSTARLEGLAWRRFLRLTNRAFRRSHMGLGAVVAYINIRRVEMANLITVSEGVRFGISAEEVRARLIGMATSEPAYV